MLKFIKMRHSIDLNRVMNEGANYIKIKSFYEKV